MSLQSIIHNALNAAYAYNDEIVKARETLKGKGADEVREALLPIVASYPKFMVPLVDGQRKAAGKKVLDSTHAKYEAANKALQRLVKDILGVTKGQTEELAVPAHIAKLAAQLAAACNEYEEARKLANTALAAAFAK